MAIAKMRLINVVGPTDEFERICANYLCNCDMHIENAAAVLGHVRGLIPYTEDNSTQTLLGELEQIYDKAGFMLPDTKNARYAPAQTEDYTAFVDRIQDEFAKKRAARAALREQMAENEQIIGQLRPLLSIDGIDVDSFFHFDFVKFRFGKMPKKSLKTLNEYLYNIDAFFIQTSADDEYVWGMYFMPCVLEDKIDGIFESLYFERTMISGKAHGTPREATVALELENERLKKQLGELEAERQTVVSENLETLNRYYMQLKLAARVNTLRKYAAHTKDSFYVVAWMDKKTAKALEKALDAEPKVLVVSEAPESVAKTKPPTKLKNNVLIRPFELFVRMYGTPAYNEIDPTGILAITYFLMFGIMFGDVGQGACIAVFGFLYGFLKKSPFGKIVGTIGISSTLFGFVYGSVFGFENILPGVIHPMERMMFMLFSTVALGAVLIVFAIAVNIVNGVRARDVRKVLFSQNGLAGLIFYVAALVIGISLFVNFGFKATVWMLALSIVLPLICIFLQEPLSLLIERRKNWLPKEKGMFLIESFFEVFEIILSYITNTMSFIRVGAFALNHVGMMSVVFLLSDMAGKSGSPVVLVLGNLLVIGLEGLIVGIQVLRLEFYELFSRFFVGDGKPFYSVAEQEKKQ